MQKPLTLYKLIVLYMLNRVNFPMTKAQVGEFIFDKGYTNFLTLQQVFSELIDADMVQAKSIRNRTHLEITETGRETLHFFENRISSSIKEDIDKYFEDNEFELRNDSLVYSNYYQGSSGDYYASMVIKEKETELINIKISVPTEEIAIAVCDKWESINEEVYKYIVEKML